MELYKVVMADPFLQGLVLAVLGTLGAGLAVIWKARTRAIVRFLDQVGVDDDEQAKLRRSMRPPDGGSPLSADTPNGGVSGRRNPRGPQNGS